MAVSVPISVSTSAGSLAGDLTVGDAPRGIVVFVHGSGSSRRSPRNRTVAAVLHAHRLATLQLDLLTEAESTLDERTGELRFDIPLLTQRVIDAVAWIKADSTGRLPIGLFGASTGAAAALASAARLPEVRAVVSRGGRPDLVEPAVLRSVRAATLFVVGGADEQVLAFNRRASAELSAPHRIEIVAGATHLFAEPGALDEVARLSADWFGRHLPDRTAVVGDGGQVG
ncbi:dienelactone hydrolase family protein [Actinoalloteichus hymeniacidonis]|uniref:Hydrolase of the alpha/beta superfamily n=1 Tax=Actinoalloteichus hymeniacidonis TaxID=340345 RepID=A0AAC9HQJ4_9PSEU|nr:dienelactone hydrolase family protein [Actinoalloteichus hymeniacidonis]AOS63519.1 putative hydrolase of the alpha/beta superfamily [Actinoalloteichus hymeniacidonis]MBB5908437.1 dienelactone hydrolase [Actinoalloteichus hymeniacidonis]